MTVQVNARVPDDVGASLDRWAAELGIERTALVRDVLAEAVQARRDGRAMFDRPEPLSLADLRAIKAKLDEQATELDRILRQNARRDAELIKSARDDTMGVSEARSAIVADVVTSMRASLEMIHGELVATRDAVADAVDYQTLFDEHLARALQRAVLPSLDRVREDLRQVKDEARKPRTATSYNIGLGQWTGSALACAFTILVVVALGFFFALAVILPGRMLAMPTSNGLLGGGDRAICRLVDYHYGIAACGVKVTGRKVTVTAHVPRVVRGGGR